MATKVPPTPRLKYPKHDNKKRDCRYTAAYEWCGYSIPLLVIRFAGERIGAATNPKNAENIMHEHQKERMKKLCAPNL